MSPPKTFVTHSKRAQPSFYTWNLSILATISAVFFGGINACNSSRSSTSHSTATLDVPQSSESSCAQPPADGYESPEIAFRHYAESVNQGKWCDAANTFEASARADLAETNFKALTLLAGAANPKREEYQRKLTGFCSRYELPCADPKWVEQAAADLITRTELAPKLKEFRALMKDNPALFYKELMGHMSAVDAEVLAKFDPVLSAVQSNDDQATGSATQADGRVSRFTFIKVGAGWMLTVR